MASAALATLALPGCATALRGPASANIPIQESSMSFDVVIVGGGPAGLSAALALGRARKRVLLCDAGPRRNAAAIHIHNFVTRDGTPPDDFRNIARQQLKTYPNVTVRDVHVTAITGERGAFDVALADGTVRARRVLVCTGMIDEPLAIEGFAELWGHAIFQCPYCHGWEAQDRRWGFLATNPAHLVPFAMQLRGWTQDLTVFSAAVPELPTEGRQQLESAGIKVVTSPVQRLVGSGKELTAIELADGTRVPCEVLFAHPPQRQVGLVTALGLALEDGLVRADPMKRETSVPGIYVAGDLATRMQAAIAAAGAGTHAAAAINMDLALEGPR